MIMTITLILVALVALNFILLAFSCNKTSKKEIAEIDSVTTKRPMLLTKKLDARQLAPTGS